jgi:putative ABC transport system ATP-binding protein
MVFQDFNLIQSMSALQNVILPMIFSNIKNKDRTKVAKKLLEEMSLENRASHKPIELSGGEQQRVAIARALVNNPDILIIDEPTGNLDNKSANEIMKIICSLNKKLRRTIVLVTHNPNHLGLADRVLSMQDGKIVSEMKGEN